MAGRLGYCAKDRTRAVLTGDEVRDCWQAEPATPEPFLGLFGSLEPPAPPPARVEAPRAAAPTAAVAAQRRWNEIVAGNTPEDPIAAHGGSVAVAARPVRERSTATRPSRPLPAWLEARTSLATTGPVDPADAAVVAPPTVAPEGAAATWSAPRPVLDTLDVPHLLDAEERVRRDPRPTGSRAAPDGTARPPAPDAVRSPIATAGSAASAPFVAPAADAPETVAPAVIPADDGMPARTVTTWSAAAPVAAAPSVLPVPTASVTTRWRHQSIDERAVIGTPTVATSPTTDDATGRRTSALSLFPATLANRLRQHLGTRGLRAPGAPEGQAALASSVPAPAPTRERRPFATARPSGPGRLVEAPTVPPVMSLGDQLRRAEQLRRERALLDAERLRGLHDRDPRA